MAEAQSEIQEMKNVKMQVNHPKNFWQRQLSDQNVQ